MVSTRAPLGAVLLSTSLQPPLCSGAAGGDDDAEPLPCPARCIRTHFPADGAQLQSGLPELCVLGSSAQTGLQASRGGLDVVLLSQAARGDTTLHCVSCQR